MLDVRDPSRYSTESACQLVHDLYGLQVSATPLPSERDQNFLLTRGGQPSWVLKIANRGEDRQALDLQVEALRLLKRREPGLPVPRLLPDLQGRLISQSEDKYLVRLLSYLEGVPLAEATPYPAGILTELGRFLGRVDNALRDFTHPAANRPLLWSVSEAEKVVSTNLHWLPDAGRRSLVERFLADFRRFTLPRLGRFRQGIIHNDANDYNVLIYPESAGREKVAGLLDFGDMIQAPVVYEAAVAAAYIMQGAQEPVDAATHLFRGYHERYPLAPDEADALHDLIAVRLCTTVTLAAKHSAQDPDRAYLTISEEGAWRVLRHLDELDRRSVIDSYREACGYGPAARAETSRLTLLRRRQRAIGPSLSLSYEDPLHIVRGSGQFLYAADGRAYLDCVNNVAHVGHCHPRVVAAGQEQMAVLNTNTRYLHEGLLRYAERLTSTLPEPLSVCFLVCSGSEANELALRLARTYSGCNEMIVLEGAYHGNTSTLIDHSPYKHNGPGGSGPPGHVHTAPMPDPYRGKYTGEDAGNRYAGEVKAIVDELLAMGAGPAGIICEPLLGCGGQLVPPPGFLRQAFDHVRAAGGVCIADEVQIGFGRVGSHFWAFESQGAVPDIVALGKPIGNGHPLAAVVTTPKIAAAFANGMEYFNTFGGNPVSCAIGLAVLDVIQQESLQERALEVGNVMLDGLHGLQERHELVGDVRGLGLFIGVELVQDREAKTPAARETAFVVEQMKARGILLSTDGPQHNVIKIKPPLVFSAADANFVAQQLNDVLRRM